MMFRLVPLLLCCLLGPAYGASTTPSYEDKDLTCPDDQHISSFLRSISSSKKNIAHKCSAYSPKLPQGAVCSPGIAFKCTGEFEGCDDPNAWISGFQVFDVNPTAEIYVPYCCITPGVKIDKCREINLVDGPSQNINYVSSTARVFHRFKCTYSKSGSDVKDMTLGLEECSYSADKSAGGSTDDKATTAAATAASTVATTAASGKRSNPEACFHRYAVTNSKLDYAESKIEVIARPSVDNAKDCASKCLEAESILNKRCLSYRFQQLPSNQFMCELRDHYVDGKKQKWLPEPTLIMYGNRTTDCN